METDFFASMLVPPFAPHPEWAQSLAETLLNPEFPISMWEDFGRRFRRNYMWIFLVLAAAWALKTFIHPTPALTFADFLSRSALGPIPGAVMLGAGLVYNGILFIIGFATAGLNQASGEVVPKWGEFPILSAVWRSMEAHGTANTTGAQQTARPVKPLRRRQQMLALIISSQPEAIADEVLKQMRRGVTALHGKGMYTKQDRDVLLVAVTLTEMQHLKALVSAKDPNAFVIVAPAQEILGRGFNPLHD